MWRRLYWLIPLGAAVACTGLYLENGNAYPCDFSEEPGVRDAVCQPGDVCGINNVCRKYIYEGPRFEAGITLTVPEYGPGSSEGRLLHPLILKDPINFITRDLIPGGSTFVHPDGGGFFELDSLGRLSAVVMPPIPMLPLQTAQLAPFTDARGNRKLLISLGARKPLRVVHRDVTPGNVLVSRNGAVLLTDFGIARIRDGSLTDPGILRGKAAYLAPEQVLHDAAVDARADIYSAALTLYEAITGTHPYKRESMSDAVNAVIEGKLPRVETLRSDITPGMATAIHHALARKPADRFSVAKEFREGLADGPVATTPELAEYVLRYCADSLTQPLEPEDSSGPGTRSLVMVTPTLLQLPPRVAPAKPARRWGAWGAAALVLLGASAWWLLRPEVSVPVAPVAPEPVLVPEVIVPVQVDVEPPPPRPATIPKRVLKRVLPPPAMRVGYLTADASPWAEVLLAGKVIDRTPFVGYPLPVGKHTLVFRGPGGEVKERSVSVGEGKTIAVRVDF